MGKVIILTHGELATSLYESTGMFIADRTGLEALGLGVDIEAFRTSLRKMLLEDAETDFLILADLFGGTPFNIAASLISEVKEKGKNMEVITGFNGGTFQIDRNEQRVEIFYLQNGGKTWKQYCIELMKD